MNNEDKYLAGKFGREDHFQVPDGYFDSFYPRLMERMSTSGEEKDDRKHLRKPLLTVTRTAAGKSEQAVRRQNKWRWIVAAVFAGIVVGVATQVELRHAAYQPTAREEGGEALPVGHYASNDVSTSYFSNSDMQAIADYTMLDNEDMYAYIADD